MTAARRRPSVAAGRLPRVHRIAIIRRAAEQNLTHERIAINVGISPMRVLLMCERHGIPVRRGKPPVRGPVPETRKTEARAAQAEGRRNGEQDKAEAFAIQRIACGGYVPARRQPDPRLQRMTWHPGIDARRPPLFSCFAENGEPVVMFQWEPGKVSREPVAPGPKRVSPSWTMRRIVDLKAPVERSEETRRRVRVAKTAKPSRKGDGKFKRAAGQ